MKKAKEKKGKEESQNVQDRFDIDEGDVTQQEGLFTPQKFDHDKIPLDVFGLLIGKRRRGKTVYLEWLLDEYKDYYASGAYVFT